MLYVAYASIPQWLRTIKLSDAFCCTVTSAKIYPQMAFLNKVPIDQRIHSKKWMCCCTMICYIYSCFNTQLTTAVVLLSL